MADLTTKIKLYASSLGVTSVNFFTKVLLQDDGSGAYIKEWNLEIAQPTIEQLNTFETAAITEQNNNNVRFKRKKEYGDIGDQLDEIFKDIDAWKARIQSIKDENPI
tara:strand:- start:937 stop:1257 length:321 start_codon:yes stop_codon:yes gene_type:complete